VHKDDGLRLIDAAITGVAHCAPPDNKPLPEELTNCGEYLRETFDLMPDVRVVMALGRIAFDACLRVYKERGWLDRRVPKPVFAHGALTRLAPGAPSLLASFHPSQQNTFTGRLTPAMMRDVFTVCRTLLDAGPRTPAPVHSSARQRPRSRRTL
jgi:uracil-DNA glycosylase family 4